MITTILNLVQLKFNGRNCIVVKANEKRGENENRHVYMSFDVREEGRRTRLRLKAHEHQQNLFLV